MKRTLLLVAVCLISINAFAQTRRASRAGTAQISKMISTQTLPIRRVILYSNGVAYIERRGTIKALTATAEAKQLITRYVSKADTQGRSLEQLN